MMMMEIDDESPMPFGKHKGKAMQDVPCDYLHYLWTTGKQGDMRCPVAAYIRANIASLEKENDDLIWD